MGIYLDHNATSPLRPEVREAFAAALDSFPGNPSSVHGPGRAARAALDRARERVAQALAVSEGEILFTSGGTESNNLAIWGSLVREPAASGGPLLIATATEHPSVLRPAAALAESGRALVIAPVDSQGLVDPRQLVDLALSAGGSRQGAGGDPRLLSVCAAGGETGAVQDLAAIGAALAQGPARSRPLFHTDAVQAIGRLPLRLKEWGVDLASFSAHKFGGPRGVGILFRASGVPLCPQLRGGEQELGLRPGTENVAAIVATATAVELAVAGRDELVRRARRQIGLLTELLGTRIPEARLVGPPLSTAPAGAPAEKQGDRRLANTATFVIPGVDGRILATRLDLAGLEASAGSACASGSLEPSQALLAMGFSEAEARAGLRLSTGWNTRDEDIHRAVDILWKTLAPSGARR